MGADILIAVSLICRMAEHAFVSERADAERKKRPNYRPIIDHDGLPRQASSKEVQLHLDAKCFELHFS